MHARSRGSNPLLSTGFDSASGSDLIYQGCAIFQLNYPKGGILFMSILGIALVIILIVVVLKIAGVI